MNFFAKLKSKKGVTGADVAAAMSIIILTVGIVTGIYVNTLNKSKDNVRYANATRIATNVMEAIQRNPFEYLTTLCSDSTYGIFEQNGGTNVNVFETKIPSGYKIKVVAKKVGGSEYDIARNVSVNVSYKSSFTYKTVTLSSVKEKELMDMTNAPDISLLPDYNPTDSSTYYYPVIKEDSNYKITTEKDVNWYDYEQGKYAIIYVSKTPQNVGANATNGTAYVWIPRFAAKNVGTGINSVQFLYGTSDYKVTLNTYGNLISYGVTLGNDMKPIGFDTTMYSFLNSNFETGDGLSGVWYKIGDENNNTMGSNINSVKSIAQKLNSRIPCINVSLN